MQDRSQTQRGKNRNAYCWSCWLQGPLHWLQSLSSQSHPHRSWPEHQALLLWLPLHGNKPRGDILLCSPLPDVISNTILINETDYHCGFKTISHCCTLLPISQTSMGSLSPQQPVSPSLCAGSSHVWHITKQDMTAQLGQNTKQFLLHCRTKNLSVNKLTWGIAP